jgi:hypothetical protein
VPLNLNGIHCSPETAGGGGVASPFFHRRKGEIVPGSSQEPVRQPDTAAPLLVPGTFVQRPNPLFNVRISNDE